MLEPVLAWFLTFCSARTCTRVFLEHVLVWFLMFCSGRTCTKVLVEQVFDNGIRDTKVEERKRLMISDEDSLRFRGQVK